MNRILTYLLTTATALLATSCVVVDDPDNNPTDTANYRVYGVTWTSVVDSDRDGYAREARLNVDVDVDDGSTHQVYFVVSVGSSSSSSYSTYYTTGSYSITGTETSDAYYVIIGGTNGSLPMGSYDILVRVYNAYDELVATYSDADNTELNDELFETASEDVSASTAFVHSARWGTGVDNDQDGAESVDSLIFDVDNGGGTESVYAAVYYKSAVSSTWMLYYTTTTFSITGSESSDARYVTIGSPNTELSDGTYDFEVRVYAPGGTLLDTYSATDDADLNDRQFETAAQDAGATFSVFNAWWYDTLDNNLNGYWKSGKCAFDADVDDGQTYTVYARLLYRLSASSTWTTYLTSSTFTITGSAIDDAYFITVGQPNTELTRGIYDFRIEIYSSAGTLLATEDMLGDGDLDNQWFETTAQDI